MSASDKQIEWSDRLVFWIPAGLIGCVTWGLAKAGPGLLEKFVAVPAALWIFGLIVHAFKVAFSSYEDSTNKLQRLREDCAETWKPKIQITGTDRVLTPNEHDFDSVFRATIVSLGFNPIGTCVARLESITRQGAEIFAHVETALTFVETGPRYSSEKQLNYGIPANLQIVGFKDNIVRIATNAHGRTLNPYADGQIQQPGEYEIRITLSAHGSVSIGAGFVFKWTGDPNTSSLHLTYQRVIAPTPPSSTPDKP